MKDGFSIRKIARLINISEDTVFRVKKHWKELLAEKQDLYALEVLVTTKTQLL